MLDLNYILENPELIKDSALSKGVTIDVEKIVELASKIKPLILETQENREIYSPNKSQLLKTMKENL